MNDAEWRSFVSAGTRTGKVAVQRENGRPHVTPVWFLLDDSDPTDVRVVFNSGVDSLKGKALRRDPHFAMAVDDQQPPYSFVLLECTAELIEEPEQLRTSATKIAHRYVGPEQAEAVGARNGVPGEYLVRGRIDKVTAQADLAA